MARRLGVVLMLMWGLSQSACAHQGPRGSAALMADDPYWQAYATLFITPGGRVVDTGNGGISHSEGQSWGMVLAVAHGDRERFDLIWRWTRDNLQVRSDSLSAWLYDPASEPPVRDRNNASDGDLMIAWAMWRAWERWGEQEYKDTSLRIRADISRHLVRELAGYTLLLPGRDGFLHGDRIHVNLSYMVMPALRDFSAIEPEGPWQALYRDARRLLDEGRAGALQLPPDWLAVSADGTLAPAPDKPPHFGFEAVRVPLFFIWGGAQDRINALCNVYRLWDVQVPPAWVDVRSGEQAEFGLSAGGMAIRALMRQDRELPVASRDLAAQDYYSASLTMLARLAMIERDSGSQRLLACQPLP